MWNAKNVALANVADSLKLWRTKEFVRKCSRGLESHPVSQKRGFKIHRRLFPSKRVERQKNQWGEIPGFFLFLKYHREYDSVEKSSRGHIPIWRYVGRHYSCDSLRSPQNSAFQPFLFPEFQYSAWEVTCVIIGHFNRFCYSFTHLLGIS